MGLTYQTYRHREAWRRVDPDLRELTVAYLRTHLPPWFLQDLQADIARDPMHWWLHRNWQGRAIRRVLANGGFTDDALGVSLLDCWIGALEATLKDYRSYTR